MDTASFRMLSPNTSMLSTGSTFRALNMAIVATGSTAEIRDPKAKLEKKNEDMNVRQILLKHIAQQFQKLPKPNPHLSVIVIL